MFDAAEISGTVEKDDYMARMPDLRAQLVEAQFHLKNAGAPVLIVIAGDDRIGCEETIDRLNKCWTSAMSIPRRSRKRRFWRHWMALPPKG